MLKTILHITVDQQLFLNIVGTTNVIQACLETNVRRLIFCSTVDVVVGYDDIIDGCEVTTATPEHFLFPGYPETKHKAESLVLKANGTPCKNGNYENICNSFYNYKTVGLRVSRPTAP